MNELSTSNRMVKLANPIFLIFFGGLISYFFLKSDLMSFFLILTIILGVGIFFYKKIDSSAVNLFYDMEFLYLKNKVSTLKIKIEKVKSIESTSHRIKILGFPFYKYRIEYLDEHLIRKTIKFWIGANTTQVDSFYKMIHSKTK